MGRKMAYIALITPKGTILPSFHKYHYNEIKENGEYFFIDGGFYNGFIGCSKKGNLICVFIDEPFQKVRQYYHIYNSLIKEYVPLKYIDNEYLESIIEWYLKDKTRIKDHDYFILYLKEKLYRIEMEYEDE